MTFKCPYTEICRADAMEHFADAPELIALFSERLQCAERNEAHAHRCAALLKLADKELPTLGTYVQQQRRSMNVPQQQLAAQAGIDLQTLRDLELNKLDPSALPSRILSLVAMALSAPIDYLMSLAKLTTQAGTPRSGTVFARSVLVKSETSESGQ